MKKLSLLLLLSVFTNVQAQKIVQSLERNVPGEGKITIYQDEAISALLGVEHVSTIENAVIKTMGYRIQVYAGNNSRTARNEAADIASRVKGQFPDLTIYTPFLSPRWLCRVGDFRSIEEADAMMRKLKTTGMFKEVAIVKEQIIISL